MTTRRRSILLLVLVPAALLLLSGSRTWVTGRTADPVLGQATVTATGGQVAPGVLALAAVILAGLVALFTGGPGIRRVSAVLMVLAAAGTVAVTGLVLRDPGAALGRQAAEQLGRTGSVAADARLTVWPWLAAAAGALLCVAGVLALLAARRWEGLPDRFERPGAGEAADRRGARRSTWDELSEGKDPTLGSDTSET